MITSRQAKKTLLPTEIVFLRRIAKNVSMLTVKETREMFRMNSLEDKIFVRYRGLPTPDYLLPCFCVVYKENSSVAYMIWTAPRARRMGLATTLLEALNITSADSKLPESMGFWTKVLPRLRGATTSSRLTQSGPIQHGELCLVSSSSSGKVAEVAQRFPLLTDHRQYLALRLKGQKGPPTERQKILLAHVYAAEGVEARNIDEEALIGALDSMGMKYYKEKTTFRGHAAYRVLIADSDMDIGQVLPLLLGSDFVRCEGEGPRNLE